MVKYIIHTFNYTSKAADTFNYNLLLPSQKLHAVSKVYFKVLWDMDNQQFVVLVTSIFYHRNSYYTFIFELWSFLTQLILQCCVHPFCLYSPSHLKSTWTHTIHKWMFGILNAFVLVISHVWESHTVPGDWLSYFVSVLFCMVGLLLPILCVSLLLAFRVTTEPKHQSSMAVESLVGSLLIIHLPS